VTSVTILVSLAPDLARNPRFPLLNYKAALDVSGGLGLRQAWENLIAWVKGRNEDNRG
jgi:hypothetical protein